MAKAEKKVRVRIRARQEVTYDQIIEMTREDFDTLTERQAEDPLFGKSAGDDDIGWLDLHDCDSGGDLEDIEIEEVV